MKTYRIIEAVILTMLFGNFSNAETFQTNIYNTNTVNAIADEKQAEAIRNISRSKLIESMVYDGKKFIGVNSYGGFARSVDGVTWTLIDNDITSINEQFSRVIWAGTQFVATGDHGIYTSPDGSIWTKQTNSQQAVLSVSWSGNHMVAVGMLGLIMTSMDGINWTGSSGLAANPGVLWMPDLNSVIWTGTKYIAVGAAGTILTSTDGKDWTRCNSGIKLPLFDVIWTGKKIMAVGADGVAVTSEDGVDWRVNYTYTQANLRSVVFAKNKFVVVGSDGAVATSADGVYWSRKVLEEAKNIKQILWAKKQFWILCSDNRIAVSKDGWIWKFMQ